MRKTVVTHGPTPHGSAVQKAAVSGQKVKPEVQAAGDENPSTAPVFAGPFSGPSPLFIDFQAYAGSIYCNPNGGTVNIGLAIVWAPAP